MHPQRVTVKSRVVKHSKYSGHDGAAAALREHIQYLGRGGVAEEGGPGVLFDGREDLSREETRDFRDAIVDDRHHFRFIVSPEAGSALDLKDYAREFVANYRVGFRALAFNGWGWPTTTPTIRICTSSCAARTIAAATS